MWMVWGVLWPVHRGRLPAKDVVSVGMPERGTAATSVGGGGRVLGWCQAVRSIAGMVAAGSASRVSRSAPCSASGVVVLPVRVWSAVVHRC